MSPFPDHPIDPFRLFADPAIEDHRSWGSLGVVAPAPADVSI